MRFKRIPGLVLILIFRFSPASSQENCSVPMPPVLTHVTVEYETGNVDLSWNPSISDNIAAYIIYRYSDPDAGWLAIDTIWNPAAREYTYITTATKYMSLRFVVAAYRNALIQGKPGCPSELSNSLSTIFSSSVIDTCNVKIIVKWNKYSAASGAVTGYRVLVSENGGPFVSKDTVAGDSYEFDFTGFETDYNYCFVINAIQSNGSESGSNKNCIETKMQRPPSWIETDYVSVNDEDKIDIGFSVDPFSEISTFDVERSGQIIASIRQQAGTITYTDDKADITVINDYSLVAVNNCGIQSTRSKPFSNIRLSLEQHDYMYNLSWNTVRKDDLFSHNYEIFMDVGNGFFPVAGPQLSTICAISMRDYMYDIKGNEVCFAVKAKKINDREGSESLSSRQCISNEELITVPDLFTPNNDLRNDLFRPVISFTPIEYKLIISDRNNKLLFETGDFMESWDGSGCENGVYLWFLRIKTQSGKEIRKTGTITILK
ncbi:MAG TPA: gliding motility-associated C-terminal domain-containing protein [Bacteroidales bacterium]|nr:gliding motility-associated C-terminal domain-containing protein [Bacteroidales bacterium]